MYVSRIYDSYLVNLIVHVKETEYQQLLLLCMNLQMELQ